VGTYLPWLRRAGGESFHNHPWLFYLHRLLAYQQTEIPGLGQRAPFWTEAGILLLAASGLFAALRRGGRGVPGASAPLIRFLGFYAVLVAAVYSSIPYKTPWCLLNFWFPTILVAGAGVVTMVRWPGWASAAAGAGLLILAAFAPGTVKITLLVTGGGLIVGAVLSRWLPRLLPRLLVGAVLLAATAHLGWQAYRASYVVPADPCNPYVYAHTTPNMVQLYEKLEELAAASPVGHEMQIQVILRDNYYWPLPWYLRKFDRRRICYSKQIPDDLGAPIVIAVPEHDAAVDARLRDTHRMTGFYALRPQVFLLLFVRDDVWEAHLPSG
jgi:predicted membrane-bound mannosyltransferase